MTLLDTHMWIWWIEDSPRLSPSARRAITEHQEGVLRVSVISCWEIAMLVGLGRLTFALPVHEWIETGLSAFGINLIPLTVQIAVASTTLPGQFHRDPADRFIVATARELDIPLLTVDERILAYPHVTTVPLASGDLTGQPPTLP